LLFLGRIHRYKRPDIAIDVLAAIKRKLRKPIHLVFAGPDQQNLTGKLLNYAQSLECKDSVHFTGLLTNGELVSVLVDSDLLISPAEVQENFGRVIVEALAGEVPVLSSLAIPMGCWADKMGVGKAVPCISECFVKAAEELLADPNKLREMGKRGRNLVLKNFDVSSVSVQLLAQYRSVVANERPLLRK
jgi:glycosyltransferase involved in cell wall biosynthesis